MRTTQDGTTRWALMQKYIIPDAYSNEPIIIRWRIFQTPLGALFIHKILLPDPDRDLHDHPWSFISIVLKGGYQEEVNDIREDGLLSRFPTWRAGSFHRITLGQRHKIRRVLHVPTWTLLLVGARVQEWGFYTENGWQHWKEYIEQRNMRAASAE